MNRVRTACVVAAVLVLGACGGDDDASDVTVAPETTTTLATTTSEAPTTTEDPTAAVEQAFYDQWDALVEVSGNPDVSSPLIEDHFIGEARDNVIDAVSRLVEEGYATRLPDDTENFDVRVNEIRVISDGEALVYECSVDGLVVYDVESGTVIDADISDFNKKNTFELSGGSWKLAKTENLAEGDPQCE